MITGPPGSRKSYIGEKLSKFFNIPHFKIKDIIEWGKTLTDELGEEIKAKLEEIDNNVKEAQETYNKRPNRKKTDLPLDLSQISKLPDEIVIKILRRKLMQNICRNRGYVLDGYPRSYKNAFALFNEDTDESKPPEDPTKYKVLTEILPNSIIRIDNCSDEFLRERMKKLEDINKDPTIIQRRLDRRLQTYKELNESKKGEPNLTNFFNENNIDILGVNGTINEGEILEQCKVFVERNGKIANYQIFDNQQEYLYKNEINTKVSKASQEVTKEFEEDEFYDNEKEKVKEDYNKGKASDLEKHEKELLEKKSEVLRRYLAENVIPVLSKGILNVCQKLPEDPVDELANYLFDNAFNAKFPPHKYKDQQ
jgi:adenylate kinase